MLTRAFCSSTAAGHSSIRVQSGATLLEALVTVVIVGFGLLGVAGLLVKGVTANTFSNYRSVAISKAYEVSDKIRSNAGAWEDLRNGRILVPTSEPSTKCQTITTGTTNSAAPNVCSSSDQAAWDLWTWKKSVQDSLPSGDASFSADPVAAWSAATVGYVFQITVSWAEKATAPGITNPDVRSFILRFEP